MKPVNIFGFVAICAVVFLVLTLFTSSCKDDITAQDLDQIVFPDSGVSYASHVEPLFFQACAFSGCHDEASIEEQGFSLDSYVNLRRRTDLVIPGDPDSSPLIWTVEGGKFSTPRMPPVGFNQLNANHIKGLRTWVKEGAQPN